MYNKSPSLALWYGNNKGSRPFDFFPLCLAPSILGNTREECGRDAHGPAQPSGRRGHSRRRFALQLLWESENKLRRKVVRWLASALSRILTQSPKYSSDLGALLSSEILSQRANKTFLADTNDLKLTKAKNLLGLSKTELSEELNKYAKCEGYRVKQLWIWIYHRGIYHLNFLNLISLRRRNRFHENVESTQITAGISPDSSHWLIISL